MSFENDRWQNIKKRIQEFPSPTCWKLGAYWRTGCCDAPEPRSHLKCCATLCQWIPLRMGLKEHVFELSLSSSDSLLQCCWAVRTQPRFNSIEPRNNESQYSVRVRTRHKRPKEVRLIFFKLIRNKNWAMKHNL
jgi:hypothetical protein